MEQARRAAVWISAGFAVLFSGTLLILLVPNLATIFPGRVTEFNTLLIVLTGAVGPAALAYGMYQPEEEKLLPQTSMNAWLSVIALTALGAAQFALLFSKLLQIDPPGFAYSSPTDTAISVVYWLSVAVFAGALLRLLWALKPSGIPRSK
ncbi:MAG: hypothetical protein AAFY10_10780 [Pseudomonadota bacterium]